MKENKSAVFRKIASLEQAKEFQCFLKEKGINSAIVDNSPAVDLSFSGNTLLNEVQLFIEQSEFEHAQKILDEQAEEQLKNIDTDHYLFSFSKEELYELLLKPDEWSRLDVKLAKKTPKR